VMFFRSIIINKKEKYTLHKPISSINANLKYIFVR
jgi:hypothetical protein